MSLLVGQFLSNLNPSECKVLNKGDFLFKQEDTALYIYVVEAGRICLVRYTTEGNSVRLHTSFCGESFAEAALFSQRYHCNAIADISSRVLCYSKKEILSSLHNNTNESDIFMSLLTNQIQMLRTRLELRNILSANERVLQYLHLQTKPKSSEINLTLPLINIAHELGLAHETFYRALNKLEKEGIIIRQDKKLYFAEK